MTRTLALVALVVMAAAAPVAPKPGVDWPQFRGIRAEGVAEGFSLPATWNAATGENVAWKAAIPGLGLSSPVVWGDEILVSTSISGKADSGLRVGYYGDIASVPDDTEHEWRIYAFDKKTGAVKWQQTAYKGVPKIKRHMKNSHANSTLATDGTRIVAFFGSEGLYAYDMNGVLNVFDAKTGEKKYESRLGGATSAFTASPVANDGRVSSRARTARSS